MAKVSKRQQALLSPYLVGQRARPDGEWDMYCPLHLDGKRSAQLNVETGVWFCHAGCGGGKVRDLIKRQEEWVPPGHSANGGSGSGGGDPVGTITEAQVRGWQSALDASRKATSYLKRERGLSDRSIQRWQIGLDGKLFTIPVRDEEGALVNIRRYNPDPPDDRRKIWGVKGMNQPRLYPLAVFDSDPKDIIVCEGEWDALLTIQRGFPAITRTSAADTWDMAWGPYFKGRRVYVCHDCDAKGQVANKKVAEALAQVAEEVLVVDLPYDVVEKHGKDLTDFWLEHGKPEFKQLLRLAEPLGGRATPEDIDPSDINVIDSFDSRNVGRPVRLTLTIKGKREPGYSVPSEVHYTCTRDAGPKCKICPLNAAGGDDKKKVDPSDPIVLELMESSKLQVGDILRRYYGIPKCPVVNIDPIGQQSVEILFARPSIDHSDGTQAGEFKNVKVTSVGRHNTLPNNTVKVVGALQPDPRKQMNEFQAWQVDPMETSLDRFELTDDAVKSMRRFQPRDDQRPLQKLGDIARDVSRHVTRIYGRPEMHAAMDLVFHSALEFRFGCEHVARGWLELLVAGDTRTGKSEAATQLCRHYRAGEVVSCESASYAGIVGGLQQYGSGKEWAINWGTIPLNDRRLVVLDEVGGLTPEEIAQMSSVRSSGTAELTKIQSERTFARTRLIWLGNPRNKTMSDYTYGALAIPELIGNAEDIARFDIAMTVKAGEVSSDEINRYHEAGAQRYPAGPCQTLVRWVWSRTIDQVHWARGAERAVYEAAAGLGKRYVETPPLVQVANVRVKVARVAVALAARLFSTDASCEKIVIKREHVEDAVKFIDRLYSMKGFGYAELSREKLRDINEAKDKRKEVRKYLRNRGELAKFLRSAGSFRREDIEQVLNTSKEEANAVINYLWASRMVRKVKGDVRVEPTLHELLREAGQ